VTGGSLRMAGIGKSFGKLLVLDDISLAAEPGQTLAVLGPSGCGKSTLLRVLAGFESADRGTVALGGNPITGPGPERGMVAQSGGLLPWLDIRANIRYGLRELGRADTTVVVDDLLRRTGLADFADSLPRHLSGGMQRRAAIAQVLATTPPVLLLDEPFAALDAQTRLRMHEWLREQLQAVPTTTVLVTHDVDEALLLADRVQLLSMRPARTIEDIAVPLGSKRGRHTLTEPRFIRLKEQLLERVLTT